MSTWKRAQQILTWIGASLGALILLVLAASPFLPSSFPPSALEWGKVIGALLAFAASTVGTYRLSTLTYVLLFRRRYKNEPKVLEDNASRFGFNTVLILIVLVMIIMKFKETIRRQLETSPWGLLAKSSSLSPPHEPQNRSQGLR